MAGKRTFNIHTVLRRIRTTVSEVADAAMFELAERGHGSVFEQLLACIISIRTYDETTVPTALALFERAPSPAAVAKLSLRSSRSFRRSTGLRSIASSSRSGSTSAPAFDRNARRARCCCIVGRWE